MDSQLLKTLFVLCAASMAALCNAKDSVKAYQCTSDAAAVQDPPAISSESRLLRVCIEGIDSAAGCHKIVTATIKQSSSSVSDLVIANGAAQSAFAGAETSTVGGVCMVAAMLKETYFMQRASSASLEVVLSGSVSMAMATATGIGTATAVQSSNGTSADGDAPSADASFELAVSLACSDDTCRHPVKAFQCTSDYKAKEPYAITAEEDMLRLCIGGINAGVKCRSIVQATLKQTSNGISDKLVLGGEKQPLFENNMEVSAKGDVCMIAIMDLQDKYFARQSSTDSLQVQISGEVSVSMADGTGGNLRKAEEATNLRFTHTIDLTAGDGDDDSGDGDDDGNDGDLGSGNDAGMLERGPVDDVGTADAVEIRQASAAESVYGIATGLVVMVTMAM